MATPLPSGRQAQLPPKGRERRLPLALAGLRLLITALVMATPGLVLQAQILRWPFLKQAVVLAGWGLVLLLLVRLASTAFGLDQVGWVLPQLLVPLIVLGILFGIPRLRVLAPYLFPPVFLLVLLAVLGQQLLASLVASAPGGGLGVLVSLVGAWGAFLLFTLLPVAIVLLPAHSLTAALGRLYRAKVFSDLSYLFGASWFLILLLQVIPG